MEYMRVTKENVWAQACAYYVRIRAMCCGRDFKIPPKYEIDETDYENEYIVAFKDTLPIGTCRLHVVDENTAKIERVVVLDEYRGTGIGREVVLAAEQWLKERGIKKVIITSRDAAVGFYEKLGYTADYGNVKKVSENAAFQIVYTEKIL